MKKILSLGLALVMALSTLLAFGTASAAAPGTFNLTLSGTQHGAAAQTALNDINATRAKKDYPAITADAALTAVAEQRAAEVLLLSDSTDTLRPDGSAVSTLVSGYGSTSSTQFHSLSGVSALSTYLYDLGTDEYQNAKSIGLSLFEYDGTFVYYAVVSVNPAQAPTTLTDRADAKTVSIATANTEYARIDYDSGYHNVCYNLSTSFYGKGVYSKRITLPNEMVTYTSSNPKVLKAKGSVGYPKSNGSYTLSACVGDTLVASREESFNALNNILPTVKAVKSAKKKTMKVTWYANITDATGYQIQYSTNKKFKKAKTVTVVGKNKTSRTIKKLKSKKVYYVRIRAYIDQGDNEVLSTKWTKAKKIKIK